MSIDLTTTFAERWQALEQLEAALGQADSNMTFTFDGAIYRSVEINGNGTMQVVNETTGQISTLDPVDVYSGFMDASGTPLPSVQSSSSQASSLFTTQQPSMFGNVMGQIGMYSGVANLVAQVPWFKGFLSGIPGFSVGLGSVTAFLSAYSLFQGIQGIFKNGQISPGVLLNLGMSTFGLATGVNSIILAGTHSAFMATLSNPAGWAIAGAVISGSVLYGSISSMVLNGVSPTGVIEAAISTLGVAVFTNMAIAAIAAGTSASFSSVMTMALLTGPWGWVAAAAVIAFAIIWSLLHQPPPEQVAAQNLTQALSPVIWTPGPLAVVAVGTIALLMGWARNSPTPVMASLTVPAYYLNQVLAASGVSAVNLKSKTPTVLVEPGTGNVVIVSPDGSDGHGNQLVTLQSYQMAKNLQFVSSPNVPPDGAYIPFFAMVNGKLSTQPSPQVVQALNTEDKMLMAVLSGTLLTHDALNALFVAAAANKYGVSLGNN